MKWPRFDLVLDGQSFDHDLFIIIRGVSAWTIMFTVEKSGSSLLLLLP